MIYNLNEMVKIILLAMDSADVNSIDDTIESVQVANLIKAVYYDLSTDLGLPEHEELFELNASGDTNKPVLMSVPSNVTELKWIKYDKADAADSYEDPTTINFMKFEDFIQMQYALRTHTSNVGEMSFTANKTETFKVMYRTDKHPEWWTTTDEDNLLFDSYDSDIDSTLQKSKTTCFGSVYPLFELTDAFQPDLDPTAFSLLLNRAKTRAFMEIKQMPNQESAAESRRQMIINQKRQRSVGKIPKLFESARFGRRGPGLTQALPKSLRQGD